MINIESDAEVYEDLKRMLLWDTFPCLTVQDVDWLFARIRRPDEFRHAPDQHRFWEASSARVFGQTGIQTPRPFTYDGQAYTLEPVSYFTASQGGTTGSTQPDWTTAPNAGDTLVDGTVHWQNVGQALWVPTWDLAWGLHRGWKLKAQQVVAQYDVQIGGQKLTRSQLVDNCLKIAEEWGRVAGAQRSIKLSGSLRTRMSIFPITNRSSDVDIVDAFLQKYSNYPDTGWAIPGRVHYSDW